MKNTGNRKVPPKRRLRHLLPAVLIFLSLFVLLPLAVKWLVNGFVLPRFIADPQLSLESGRLEELTYHRLSATNLVLDAGSGVYVRADRIDAAYSPQTLLLRTVPWAHTRVTLDPYEMVAAEIDARDICLRDGIRADVTAQCDRMSYGAWSAGPFCATSHLSGTEAKLAADIPLQDGLLKARIDLHADWKTNPVWNCTIRLPLDVEEGLCASGLAAAEISGSATATVAVLSLAVSDLDFPAHSLSLSNLYTSCTIKLPGELRSQPGQRLTADSLSVGELRIEQIRMHYQVEPDSVFFIEDLDFKWCGGRVSLYSARVGPEAAKVSVHLFCDRLSLEQVLAACGLTGFSAGGELNGRLPVEWAGGGLSVDHGFLFTTPGKGGTFSFGSAEAAAGILPPGSLEEGQLGLVAAALAAFDYNWITMTLNTEGENLRIEIEADGQPVNILPYEYDSRSGSYVKIELRPGRGIRQPMRFKLNLTVPLNQLLCYASGINRQWNLFKAQP